MIKRIAYIFLVCGLIAGISGAWAENYDPSASVYRFQKKMAERGNASSQFKLGLMYETGSGVKTDIIHAIRWYRKAASQDYKPAQNRLTYLNIKKERFSPKYKHWSHNLKTDAQHNEYDT